MRVVRTMNTDNQAIEQKLESLLHGALYRFDCPSPETLHHYHWDELNAADRKELDAHLGGCDPCTLQLEQLQTLMADDDISEAIGVGAIVNDNAIEKGIAAAADGLRDTLHAIGRKLDDVSYVIASLVEPPANLSPIALRSAKSAPTLTIEDSASLTFEAGDNTLSLILQRDPDGTLRLSGQLLSIDPLGEGAVKLIADGSDITHDASLDDAGSFFLQNLQPNHYQLTVFLETTTIIIPRLKIG